MPTEQDRNTVSLFSPERVFELIRYFILFDANVKKVCRYQQFFAVREIMKTIAESDKHGNRQSGVIWHTQGSGKRLTMVCLLYTSTSTWNSWMVLTLRSSYHRST